MVADVDVLVLVRALVVVVLLSATDWLRLALSRLTEVAGLLACMRLGDDRSQTGELSVSAVGVSGADWLVLSVLMCDCETGSVGVGAGYDWALSLTRFGLGAEAGE